MLKMVAPEASYEQINNQLCKITIFWLGENLGGTYSQPRNFIKVSLSGASGTRLEAGGWEAGKLDAERLEAVRLDLLEAILGLRGPRAQSKRARLKK